MDSLCGHPRVGQTPGTEGQTKGGDKLLKVVRGDDQARADDEDADLNKKTIDDGMRNEIVEYLLKGIRRSIITYSNRKRGPLLADDEDEGGCFLSGLFRTICGCCFKESPLPQASSPKDYPSSFKAGYGTMLKRVNLIERHAIMREARREVLRDYQGWVARVQDIIGQ